MLTCSDRGGCVLRAAAKLAGFESVQVRNVVVDGLWSEEFRVIEQVIAKLNASNRNSKDLDSLRRALFASALSKFAMPGPERIGVLKLSLRNADAPAGMFARNLGNGYQAVRQRRGSNCWLVFFTAQV
jgi:hypothetical protein